MSGVRVRNRFYKVNIIFKNAIVNWFLIRNSQQRWATLQILTIIQYFIGRMIVGKKQNMDRQQNLNRVWFCDSWEWGDCEIERRGYFQERVAMQWHASVYSNILRDLIIGTFKNTNQTSTTLWFPDAGPMGVYTKPRRNDPWSKVL
jgi:hypothetical protein